MRGLFAAVALGAVLSAGAAYAGAMDNTFGNTIGVTNKENGATSKMFFEPDGTYTATAVTAEGQEVSGSGTWTEADGRICITPTLPADAPEGTPQPATSCGPLEEHQVGDTWDFTNDAGENFTITLTAGR